mmetsp:Transcript_11604/g.24501  ORF Transcript_11604/g.24501 Transcript_11604/m.24501 type:complete len:209 (+) Transcript_11604:1116-1742(+)
MAAQVAHVPHVLAGFLESQQAIAMHALLHDVVRELDDALDAEPKLHENSRGAHGEARRAHLLLLQAAIIVEEIQRLRGSLAMRPSLASLGLRLGLRLLAARRVGGCAALRLGQGVDLGRDVTRPVVVRAHRPALLCRLHSFGLHPSSKGYLRVPNPEDLLQQHRCVRGDHHYVAREGPCPLDHAFQLTFLKVLLVQEGFDESATHLRG